MYDPAIGVALMTEQMIANPEFLYVLEFGKGGVAAAGDTLTGTELATRLALFLTGSGPDDTLLAHGEAGDLDSATTFASEVQRLLTSTTASAHFQAFAQEWLETSPLDGTDFKPNTSISLGTELMQSLNRFVANAMLTGKYADLWTSVQVPMTADIASRWGASVTSPDSSGWQTVAVNSTQRGGLLTHPAIMETFQNGGTNSTTQRGRFVYEKLLCKTILGPRINTDAGAHGSYNNSVRGHAQYRMATMPCLSCHTFMDGIGLLLEKYDATGSWKTVDDTDEVGMTNALMSGTDVDATYSYTDPTAFASTKMAGSADVRNCVSTQLLRYAYGRDLATTDATDITSTATALGNTSNKLSQVLSAIVSLPTFQHLPSGGTN
jgi:hypothetical protein